MAFSLTKIKENIVFEKCKVCTLNLKFTPNIQNMYNRSISFKV